MAMANLPAKRPESSITDDHVATLAARIANGEHPRDIARKLHPTDRRARRRTYMRLRNLVLKDARVAAMVADDVKVEMLVGLGPATYALSQRAARGRPDAIKLLYEASGFHNPRIKHEHSGEIKIKLDMPRPKFDEDIVDADVVDGPE